MDETKEQIIKMYSPGGLLAEWPGPGKEKFADGMANKVASLITCLNLPKTKNGEVRILSPSANTAIMEAVLQEKLDQIRRGYRVVSGDIAVKPLKKSIPFHHMDADQLPFPDNCFSVVYDWLGALWHKNNDGLIMLLKEYKRVLVMNGVLLIDNETGPRIEKAFDDKIEIPGFEAPKKYRVGNTAPLLYVFAFRRIP